jgi:hypothetical protein
MADYELLRYSDTILNICTKGWTRRQLHDLERQVMLFPTKIIVCSCLTNPWVKETLAFLGAQESPAKEQCLASSTPTP